MKIGIFGTKSFEPMTNKQSFLEKLFPNQNFKNFSQLNSSKKSFHPDIVNSFVQQFLTGHRFERS